MKLNWSSNYFTESYFRQYQMLFYFSEISDRSWVLRRRIWNTIFKLHISKDIFWLIFKFEIEVENFSFTFENLGDHFSNLVSLLVWIWNSIITIFKLHISKDMFWLTFQFEMEVENLRIWEIIFKFYCHFLCLSLSLLYFWLNFQFEIHFSIGV